MKKFFLRFLLIIGIFVALVIGGLAIVLGFFEEAVGKKVVESINNNLRAELAIEEVDLTLFRSFPNAAVNLRGTALADTQGNLLLEAENVSFRFKVLSIFGKAIKINSVLVENGALVIRYDEQGNSNYEVWKTTEEEVENEESSALAISLQQATLDNIELIYEDEQNEQYAFIILEEANFSGEFSNDQFELISSADFQTQFVEYGDDRFLSDKDVYYTADILVDLTEGLYELKEVNVGIENNAFDLTGRVTTAEDFTDFNVVVRNEDGDLGGVLQLLPGTYAAYLQDFKSKGQYYFDALIDGKLSKTEQPIIEVKFGLEEGRISSPRLDDDFRDVSFDAIFSNGNGQSANTSRFEMPRMKGYFNNELVELKFNAYNFDDPSIDFALNGTLPLEAVYGLFGNENITGGSGEVEVRDLEVRGRLADIQQTDRIDRVDASGTIQFDDARLIFDEERLTIDRGDILIEGNSIVMKEVKIEGVDSEIYLDGSCYNLLPVLFADSLNSKRAELEFEANLRAPKLDLDRLIALTTSEVEEGEVSEVVFDSIQVAEAQGREQFTQFLKGSFNADVQQFNYNKIEGRDFKGRLQFNNNELSIFGNTKAMEGNFDLSGTLYFEQQPRLKAKLIAKNVNAYEFFGAI